MPTTDEVWRLQRGDDPECQYFQSFAGEGHYRAEGGTRQGIYVCTPGGRLLGSINSLDANEVREMMTSSLAAWSALSVDERQSPGDLVIRPAHRWEASFPETGLVLTATVRDLPSTLDPSAPRNVNWNRDHAWFSRDEARMWLPRELTVGARWIVPEVIVERLSRFHLVDTVRGQSLPFAREEIVDADIMTEIVEVVDGRAVLNIGGYTRAEASGVWVQGDNDWKEKDSPGRGMSTVMVGRATYEMATGGFTSFELVAIGARSGGTRNNGRGADLSVQPIGFVFELGTKGRAGRVPPAFIDVYNADWVVRPER